MLAKTQCLCGFQADTTCCNLQEVVGQKRSREWQSDIHTTGAAGISRTAGERIATYPPNFDRLPAKRRNSEKVLLWRYPPSPWRFFAVGRGYPARRQSFGYGNRAPGGFVFQAYLEPRSPSTLSLPSTLSAPTSQGMAEASGFTAT